VNRLRKALPPDLAPAYGGFLEVLAVLEPAKAGLTDVLPGTRMPGRPLSDALAAFEAGLREAADRMEAWRAPAVSDEWEGCRHGLEAASALAVRLRTEPPELAGFEGLLGLVETLLDPLEAFAAAEERFRSLRRRGGVTG